MIDKISIDGHIPVPNTQKEIRDFIRGLPKAPGVYKFLDVSNNPLYIGKAKLLNKRIASYFQVSSRTQKIKKLFDEVKSLEFSLTNTELESLLHEQFLIKEHKPKFNVQFKDDKGYPWIRIDIQSEFPSAKSYLGKKDSKGKFFGPFPNSYAVRDALKLIQKTFKLRNCSESYYKNRTRPCLQYEIGRCSAPCVGFIATKDYRNEVKGAELLLEGNSNELIDDFYKLMDKFSIERDYEKAAVFRDRISALRDIQRSQSIAGFQKNRDAIYLSYENGRPKIGVSNVNQGWVTGHKNFKITKDFMESNILERFIEQNYLSKNYCPPVLVIGSNLENKAFLERVLSNFHGKKISIISRPGKKDKGLLEICKVNTEYALKKERIDPDISFKIDNLKQELRLKYEVTTIESYDVSHHSAENAIAGCVVYSKEGKTKDLYRTYKISEENSGNDIGSMIELVDRRFKSDKPMTIPSLIIIDGSKTHLNSVKRKFRQLDLGEVNIIAISKGIRRKRDFDSIHLSNGKTINTKNGTVFTKFIQEIRDETHKYAISSLKKRRAKSSISSSIDNLRGIGNSRKKNLLRYFGSLEQIKRASIDDLIEVPGIGKNTAKSIFRQIHN